MCFGSWNKSIGICGVNHRALELVSIDPLGEEISWILWVFYMAALDLVASHLLLHNCIFLEEMTRPYR